MSNNKESLIKQLTQKPWEPAQVKVDNLHEGKTFNLHVSKQIYGKSFTVS